MSLDIRPAIPMPLRRRQFHSGLDRLTHILVNVAVSLGVTVAVTLATAVGLTLGLN